MLNDLMHRLRAVFRRDAVERELADEMQWHLEHEIEKRVAAGTPRDTATREARLAFGGFDQIAEAHRDARGITLFATVAQDIRYAVRTARRSPLFAITAIATLALFTGALATVLTLGYTLLFRRLPVERPYELVDVSGIRRRTPSATMTATEAAHLQALGPVSYPDYVAFRNGTRTLAGLAAHYPTAPLFVSTNGDAREVNGAAVSANFFSVLGLRPVVGRFFHDDEDRVPDRDRVVVVSADFWRTWLGASPSPAGMHVRINGTDFTVVGVVPASFVGMTKNPIQLYVPTMMLRVAYRWCDDALAAECSVLRMIGRLAPGRTLADAATELPTLMPAAWAHAPAGENSGVVVSQAAGMSDDDDESRLVGILGAAAVVLLLVCCANLAGLVGAQTAARAHEFAVRLSLGAGPLRIVRQLTTEASLFALLGGAIGVVLSQTFVHALAAMFFAADDEGHLLWYDFSQTPAIVAATIVVALCAGIVFSIVPAIRAVRPGSARLSGRSVTSRWSSGAWLLRSQAAVAVAMVSMAALLASSAAAMLTGGAYEASHVALIRVRPRLVKYSPERAQQFQREVVRRLDATPGVESVSMVGIGSVLSGSSIGVALPGWSNGTRVNAGYNEVGPRYFATLKAPPRAGREFDERDRVGAPRVAIVNDTLAARLWPGGGALGATIVVDGTARQVVGIVPDLSARKRARAAEPWAYTPFWQNAAQIDSRMEIRTAGDPRGMLPAIARAVNGVDPDVPIAELITLPDRLTALARPVRVGATFIGYTAALAVLLTAIGLYGSLAFAVSRRTKEIGIRMALGAARARIVSSVVCEGLSVVGAGAAGGLALAAAGTRLVTHMLYASSGDAFIYALAAALVLAVGLLASLTPARRAASVEPLIALRCD